MDERTNTLNLRESLDQSPTRFAASACDEDHIADYTEQSEVYEKMIRTSVTCHFDGSLCDVLVERLNSRKFLQKEYSMRKLIG